MTSDQWDAVINTNLNSLFNMTRPVIDGMRDRSFGRIIMHLVDQRPEGPDGPDELFRRQGRRRSASRRRSRRKTPRKGITVNVICPGYIATEMVKAVPRTCSRRAILPQIPVGRLGEPEEIARGVVFLASDDAGFITGSTLTANGGQYLV